MEKALGEPRFCLGLFNPAEALFPLGNACRVKGISLVLMGTGGCSNG